MKKNMVLTIFSVLLLSSVILAAPLTKLNASGDGLVDPPGLTLPTDGLIINRDVEHGRITSGYQAIYGPNGCIALGDPYSPADSPYTSPPHVYTYLIRIPQNYPSNIVRVELFDPDSINVNQNTFIINRTNTAVANGLSPTDSKSCGSDGGNPLQTEACALDTNERTLVTTPPTLNFDEINPQWLVRVDNNRFRESPSSCSTPTNYTPAYNTQTIYSLYYFAQGSDDLIMRIPLVDYVGQTGDGLRDNGDHLTDLRWVSPGADVPFSNVDHPGVLVPAVARTIDSFEVDLTTDIPNLITDMVTGNRYLYLDVQTLSGTSKNGFDIWAGPPNYLNTVPSEVNARNLYLLNNPDSHHSADIEVLALGSLPQNRLANYPIEVPLMTIGPEYIGQSIDVTIFDVDAGTLPPVVFYFDTLAFTPDDSNPLGYDPDQTDWALAFSVAGQPDPDGVTRNCSFGNCNLQWVTPPYTITIPGNLTNCTNESSAGHDCIPFNGGRLMVRFLGGENDMHTWEIRVPELLNIATYLPYITR